MTLKDQLGPMTMQGSVPSPDPTVLTTENLRREILGLRELLEVKIEAAAQLSQQQFALVERQRVEQKQDTKTAVDAALSAQKEAVHEQTISSDKAISKSEYGTTKQIEQLAENFRTAQAGVVQSIDDLKDRVRGIEANKQGATESRGDERWETRQRTQTTQWGIAVGVSIAGLLVGASIAIAPHIH